MATPSKTADEILKSYVTNKRQRGVFTDPAFDKYVPKSEPVNPVIINQTATLAGPTSPTPVSDIEKIAKPVLGSWLKGKSGYAKILRTGALDTDTHGGNTVNGYWNTARKFDDPTLPLEERITKMIYGVETSGNPDAWRTINDYGYMGRAQMGKAFMSDYGIDPTMYMKDPNYQHKVTVNAVKKRIGELKGVYFRQGGKIVSGNKPYHGNSKKEDLLIVNPKDGSIYGAMRYDEIVFSQKDSNKIESLIEKGDTAKLGEFVASARAKQNDFVPLFAGGGKVTAEPSLSDVKKDRLSQLESLKNKIPDSIYQKYKGKINDSRSYSEVILQYKKALEDWAGDGSNPSSQAPNAIQIQSLKDSYIKQLTNLGAPKGIVNKFKDGLSRSITGSDILKEYDNAVMSWGDSASNSPTEKKTESVKSNQSPPLGILESLSGGKTKDGIISDIESIKKRISLVNKKNTPEAKEELSILDKVLGSLESASAAITPNFEKDLKRETRNGAITKAIDAIGKASKEYYEWNKERGLDIIGTFKGPVKAFSQIKSDPRDISLIDKVFLLGAGDAASKVVDNIKSIPSQLKKFASDYIDGMSTVGGISNKGVEDVPSSIKDAAKEFYGFLEDRGRDLLSMDKSDKKISFDDLISGPDPVSALVKGLFGIDGNKKESQAVNPTPSRGSMSGKGSLTPIQQVTQTGNPTPSRGSLPSGGKVGDTVTQDTKKIPTTELDSVKATQEYLNNFFIYNAAKQKGYTVGDGGRIFDENGKEVPVDKIASEAKNERIAVDGRFGPETERAIKIYNAANPDKPIRYSDSEFAAGRLTLTDKGDNTPDYLKKYYETGKVPRYGIEEIKPLKGKDLKEIGIKEASPTIPKTPVEAATEKKVTPESVKNLLSSENLQRVGANIGDMAKMAALYRETGKPLPIYEQTEDWKKYTAMVENNATQGLNAAVQSQFNRDLNTNRALGYGQVVAASGGGGTQGAVLGALGNINQASANAIGQFAVADQAQRDKNLSQFGQVARTNEQINLSMYSQELQNAQNARMQAASLIPQIKSQIEGRNDMYNAYGPGSSYQKLIQSQLEKQQAEVDMTKRLAENPSLLFSQSSGVGTTDLISTADKSMIEQQKARYGIKPVVAQKATPVNPNSFYDMYVKGK